MSARSLSIFILIGLSLLFGQYTLAMGSRGDFSLSPCLALYEALYNYPGCSSASGCHLFNIKLITLGEGDELSCAIVGRSDTPVGINTSEAMALIASDSDDNTITVDEVTFTEAGGLVFVLLHISEGNFFNGLTDYRFRYQNVSGSTQETPVHFISFQMDETSLPARELPPPPTPDECDSVTCPESLTCVTGECVCPTGTVWSEGSEACVEASVCDQFPAICAGTGGATGGAGVPPPGGPGGPTSSASGGGGCTQIASRHASPLGLAWLALPLLAFGWYRLRYQDRI